MDLSIGQSVSGQISSYIIHELLSFTDRSKSYSCISSDGQRLRLKLYDGNNTMKGSVRRRYCQLPMMQGVIFRVDYGDIDGCPFDVFEMWQDDISRKIISQSSIKKQIVMPLNEGLRAMHKMGILIRDITPSHVLFYDYSHTCALSGFSDLTLLNRAATSTHKRSFGTDTHYIAPEVEREGYSSASDYYALGVTLYAIYKGYRALDSITEAIWINWKTTGMLPNETSSRIRGGSFSTFTQNDRLEYLIMGLTLPDSSIRWGYGEVKAWCYDQDIPLVQMGNREDYEMAMPLIIRETQCWNYRQIAERLAGDPDTVAVPSTLQMISNHISQWDAETGVKLQTAMRECSSGQGIVFRWIYILDPSTQGLWWNGKKYSSCGELAREAELNENTLNILSDILREGCISFWLNHTTNSSNAATKETIRSLEIEESREKTVGAYHFIQVYGMERHFRYHGLIYHSISELLGSFSKGKAFTDNQAREILKNQSFRAWVWANGYDNTLKLIEENEAQNGFSKFNTFLLLCEKIGMVDDREIVRRIYLKYGEFAPVFWLQENIDKYSFVGFGENLKIQFLSGFVTEALSLGQMQMELPKQLRVYLEIVRASKDKREVIAYNSRYAFIRRWENIEVTTPFLESIGAS